MKKEKMHLNYIIFINDNIYNTMQLYENHFNGFY